MNAIRMKNLLFLVKTLLLGLLLSLSTTATAVETITFIHTDLFNSPVAATDINGKVIWREDYRPYGRKLKDEPGSASQKIWYTGKPQDPDSGLVYMGARHYNPQLGRFISVDPVSFQEGNIHSFNRYAYGNNNPYKYVDPDGEFAITATLLLLSLATFAYDIYDLGANPNVVGDDSIRSTAFPDLGISAGLRVSTKLGSRLVKRFSQRSTDVTKGTRSVDDLIKGSKLGGKTKGRTSQFDRSGGFGQANKDFDALGPKNVKDIDTAFGPGRTGALPDGRQVNVRPGSSNSGPPTLEIQQGKNRIKFRFGE